MSGLYNRYGGSTENRFRIVGEILERSVQKVGDQFPIFIKMNVDDCLEGGIDLTESTKIAALLWQAGFAAIETSSCMWEVLTRSKEELGWEPAMIPESRVDIGSRDQEAYHLPYAREIKKVIDVPLVLVGGIRSFDVAEEILAEGSADFISLSRPLVRQPDLPNRWLKGIGGPTAECVSCNGCVGSLMGAGSLECVMKDS
jgi:2,4-dienoyl-CoA reductase-like NADH-dependent reductase (Old Yellow Enzyme family)